YEELTSRKPNSKITEIIQKNLKVKYPNTDSLHFVLASNMISVGVDVDRLSLMAVTGQPKTNAEYIQATSRVGRSTPGLVVDMLSASKSRDRSHYEQYLYYHSALYKFVEATSITPFSDRAREKALDAVFISLCRNLITELKSNDSAGNFVPDNEEVDKIEEYIIDYARKVDDSELNSLVRELNEIKKRWYNLAAFFNDVSYAVYGQNQGVPLLKNKHDEAGEFLVLNSMRNIDLESTVYIKE
ncbi:MAG: helicase-related protein, partial [bacterium]